MGKKPVKEEALRRALNHLPLKEVRFYESVGSTNDVALKWADEGGAEDASLVVANAQTAGRGRFKRTWVTRPGAALAFSLILRPADNEDEGKSLALYAPLGALAVCIALERQGLTAQIKWPNDVLLDGKKVAGILSEASWRGGQAQYAVVGIGVNVAPGSVPPPEELQFPAISVEQALGRGVEGEALLAVVLDAFFEWREGLYSESFIQAWEKRLAFRGERVMVSNAESGVGEVSGVLLGISREGAARIKMDEGRVEEVLAGDVSLRPLK
jgi:BirA family biotin operon repressor/biotin-[acetyl-CoA-carboxylase] ligase